MRLRTGLAGLALAAIVAGPALAVPASADLSVTMTDGATTMTPEVIQNYLITVTNNGPDAATDIVVTNFVPVQMALSGASHLAAWDCTFPAGATGIVCTRPSLAAGESAVVQVWAYAVAGATGVVANTVTVTTSADDPVPANNSATDTNTIGSPVAVPTLSEWALILLGLVLAGGAALHLHRRRLGAA